MEPNGTDTKERLTFKLERSLIDAIDRLAARERRNSHNWMVAHLIPCLKSAKKAAVAYAPEPQPRASVTIRNAELSGLARKVAEKTGRTMTEVMGWAITEAIAEADRLK